MIKSGHMDNSIPNTLNIGSIQINLYGLLLGIGFIIIYFNVDKRYSKQIKLIDYVLVLTATVVGARVFFIFNNLELLLNDYLLPFRIYDGGLALFGALSGLLLSVYFVCKRRGIRFLQATDTIFTYLPLAQAIGRFGNYLNQELYGSPTKLPWGIYISQEKRLEGYEEYEYFHPTFLYEAILDVINFIILSKIVPADKVGYRTAFYFINYAIIRILINRIRIDKEYFGPIENSDLYSLIALIGGIILFYYLYRSYCQYTAEQDS